MTAQVAPAPAATDEVPWSRTSPRTVLVHIMREAKVFIPALILMIGFGSQYSASDVVSLVFGVLSAVLPVTVFVASWWGRRYRVTDEAVELRVRLFGYQRRATTIPRARVRSVTTSAHLPHRLVGLVVVTVSSGSGNSAIVLEAMSRQDAERLALTLTGRTTEADAHEDSSGEKGDVELVRLDLRWLRYAPMGVAGFAALAALAWVLIRWFGEPVMKLYLPDRNGTTRLTPPDAAGLPGLFAAWGLPWWVVAVAGVLALLLAATIAAMVVYLLAHWGFRLVRTPDESLTSTYGLVSRGGSTIPLAHVSGVTVNQRPLQRLAGAATATAFTFGRATMLTLPPAPRDHAHRVSATVLHGHHPDAGPTLLPLRRRPQAALRRRVTWAIAPALAVVAAALVPVPWWHTDPLVAVLLAAVLLPTAIAIGVGSYRSLGDTLTERYLVTRAGHLRNRQTIAVDRSAIIGWRITSSPLQRRAGLLTVDACVSTGYCPMPDIDARHGLALAREAKPDLLGQFLRPTPTTTTSSAGSDKFPRTP